MLDPSSNLTHADEVRYSFKPSVLGAPRNFRLTADGIVWDAGARSGRVAYDRVTRVRMSFRPATTQNKRFVTEIWSADGPKLGIVSSSWKSMAEQVRLDKEYRTFVLELHRRLNEAGRGIRFERGTHPLLFWSGLALFVIAGLGLAGLIVRAIEASAHTAALLVGLFLALFVWQGATFFRRDRPGSYRPDALPELLLPDTRT
jgi:hypothetical protein